MDIYTSLARTTIKHYLYNEEYLKVTADLDQSLLTKRAGVFVSLHIKDDLRGCMGSINPTQSNLALEIINNAFAAAFNDPRFMPITKSEINKIKISVDILSAPEKTIVSKLDPKIYGIIVKKSSNVGVLLPDIGGVDTGKQQLMIACQKAGIEYDLKDYEVYRFKVDRYHE